MECSACSVTLRGNHRGKTASSINVYRRYLKMDVQRIKETVGQKALEDAPEEAVKLGFSVGAIEQ